MFYNIFIIQIPLVLICVRDLTNTDFSSVIPPDAKQLPDAVEHAHFWLYAI